MTAPRLSSAPGQAPGVAATHQDAELVRAVLQRDRKATAELVALHSDAIYAFVRMRLLPRVDLIEDLVQDVFVAALGSLAGFSGASSLRTWLLGIARHKVEDYYRDCLKQPEPLDDLADGAEEPRLPPVEYEDALDATARQQRVLRVLAGLPESYRVVLLWRYWEKRSAREMAEDSGRTEKAVERLLARAREAFRRRWSKG